MMKRNPEAGLEGSVLRGAYGSFGFLSGRCAEESEFGMREDGGGLRYNATTVQEYIASLPDDRRQAIEKLRNVIVANLPAGFEEQLLSGMIGYVVPLSRYPKGYHVKKGEPLPFMALASQKHFIALYHLGLYSDDSVSQWFVAEYAKRVPTKLDMGKSCIRFKNLSHIPYSLVGELCQKFTVLDYTKLYEQATAREQDEPTKTIDAYIAAEGEEVRPLLQKVRAAIRAVVPHAEERLSWGMPTFWHKHNIIHFAAAKKHIGLYPGPMAIEHFAPRLAEYVTSKGAVQFPYNKPLPLELIADMARWCSETGNHH